MKGLFPRRSEPELGERDPKLVDLADEGAEEVFDALGSETPRAIFLELHAEPRPASELAEAVDTTVQNVQYHLRKLEAAGLIEVVDTWYSGSGSEMAVYAPADEALVVFAGEEPASTFRRLLERLVGALAVLAAGAAAVWLAVGKRGDGETSPGTGENATAVVRDAGPDPLLTAGAFVLGGLVALAGLILADRLLE